MWNALRTALGRAVLVVPTDVARYERPSGHADHYCLRVDVRGKVFAGPAGAVETRAWCRQVHMVSLPALTLVSVIV